MHRFSEKTSRSVFFRTYHRSWNWSSGRFKSPHRSLFQLSPSESLAKKQYVKELPSKNKIRPSRSPYGPPLFFVKQKGRLRGVKDYRELNRITKRNNAPIQRTDEMFERLGNWKVFLKLDLKSGFHQILVRKADIEKTAFKTKYGHYEFLVMPIGLCNVPETFQALMNSIFSNVIDDFLVVYLDDLLIYSKSHDAHLEHLGNILERLHNNRLFVGKDIFQLMTKQTEFLGLKIGVDGISVGDDRKKRVREWPKPSTLSELREFFGFLQGFRRFIKNFSHFAAPLTNLTRRGSGTQR